MIQQIIDGMLHANFSFLILVVGVIQIGLMIYYGEKNKRK